MLKSDIQPPRTGLNADPILYGVAAGLAELFPPVSTLRSGPAEDETDADGEEGSRTDTE